EGRVQVGKSFRVGPTGHVHGEVNARSVSIAGHVEGDVIAAERVEILPTGILEGNIRSPKIVIAEGAQFKGRVDMAGPDGPANEPDGGAG
ncbi:MAG TPA: polymer-forming cytoskeletal protein, partial [Thermoanaerobaculia bacterium]|nr:polymer-forming cytoskeletal protein [Thermoanaerobaculia bacterium]